MRRLGTGVPGLDEVLGGGILAGTSTALAGPAGSGKTTLALQMCFSNATTDHPALYYTALAEPHYKLTAHLEQFDFFAPEKIGTQVEFLHLGDLIHRGPGGLEPMVEEVLRKALEAEPVLVVIDNTTMLHGLVDEIELRQALYDLSARLGHTGTTLILIDAELSDGPEFVLADNVIELAYEPHDPVDRRWLRAVKVRHARHLSSKHGFHIGAGGCEVYPRIETLDFGEAAKVTRRIASGIPGLDELVGGGIGEHEATIILGPSGISKTIFGLQFVHQGLAQGERCLYVTFSDTPDQLVKMAAGFGWDLQTARAEGRLSIHLVPSDQLDLDVLASRIRTELARGAVGRVVIDGLAEMVLAARDAERFPAYGRSLIGLIRSAGATLLVSSETAVLGPPTQPQANGIMFLFHNVIMLRYIELPSQTGRTLSVVKMRNSDHSKQLHQLEVGADGLRVTGTLERPTGVLGWTALRAPDPNS